MWLTAQGQAGREEIELEGITIDGNEIGDWRFVFSPEAGRSFRLEPVRELWLRREGQDIDEVAKLLAQQGASARERAISLAAWISHALRARPPEERILFIDDPGGTRHILAAQAMDNVQAPTP